MFRNGLLVSTAMTAVALLLSGARAAQAQTGMHVADRDANARFLCTYGKFDVDYLSSSENGIYKFYSQIVAVPVVGRGQTVRQITVLEARSRLTTQYRFSAGIYANEKGRPGKLIAGGTGSAFDTSSCQEVVIPIPKTTLQPKTKYWIEENAKGGIYTSTFIFWYVNPKEKRSAFVQTYAESCSSRGVACSTYSQPWTKASGAGPWFKLK